MALHLVNSLLVFALRERTTGAARPSAGAAALNLGNRLLERGIEREAISHYEDALRHRPGWGTPALGLAWLLATTADPALRDPPRALALAEVARADTDDLANALDTLAAAQAAAGDYDAAAATAMRAVRSAMESGRYVRARAFDQRRGRYMRRLPYVEPRPAGPISNSSVR